MDGVSLPMIISESPVLPIHNAILRSAEETYGESVIQCLALL